MSKFHSNKLKEGKWRKIAIILGSTGFNWENCYSHVVKGERLEYKIFFKSKK